MRALVFHGPWQLTVEERPEPEPGPGEVVVDILATGICGSDLHGFTGENGRREPGQVMGHETVGRVALTTDEPGLLGQLVTVNPVIGCGRCPDCAAGATQRCTSRRVIGVAPEISSAFAERIAVPAANVVRLPDVPTHLGTLVEPLAVGFHAGVRAGITPDDRVLVVGGGPIGQAAALAARRLGAGRVLVSEPSAARRSLVEHLGFAVVDPVREDVLSVLRRTLGDPASVVLDAVGSTESIGSAIAGSTVGARIVLVGMQSPRIELSAYSVSTEERTLLGSFCYDVTQFRATAEWAAANAPLLGALVEGTVPMEGAAEAFRLLATGEWAASKILVTMQEQPIRGADG